MKNIIYTLLNSNDTFERMVRVGIAIIIPALFAKSFIVFGSSALVITFLMSFIGKRLKECLPIIIDDEVNTMACMKEAD